MLIIFNLHWLANCAQSSRRAIEPKGQSGFTSSHIRPAAGSPASLQRSASYPQYKKSKQIWSWGGGELKQVGNAVNDENWPIAASVCPLLVRTPPSLARRGTMCPGRVKSSGRLDGSLSLEAVNALSWAEIPVAISKKIGETEGKQNELRWSDYIFWCLTAWSNGHLYSTVFIVDCVSICGFVLLRIGFDHQRDFKLVQPFTGKSDADIPARNKRLWVSETRSRSDGDT
jgi:hypothetical protein